jgi:hypothetical protein
LAYARLEDAEVLLRAAQTTRKPQRRVGAVYLAGYAVECALKARICYERQVEILSPQFYTHDLRWLLEMTGLSLRAKGEQAFWRAFSYVQVHWSVALRYQMPSLDAQKAREFLDKTKEIMSWLSNG